MWRVITSNKISPTFSRPSCSATPPEQISFTLSMLPLVPPTNAKPRPPPSGFVKSTCMMQLYKSRKMKNQGMQVKGGCSFWWFYSSVFTVATYIIQKRCHCVVDTWIRCTESLTDANTHMQTVTPPPSRESTRRLTHSRLMLQCVFQQTLRKRSDRAGSRWEKMTLHTRKNTLLGKYD